MINFTKNKAFLSLLFTLACVGFNGAVAMHGSPTNVEDFKNAKPALADESFEGELAHVMTELPDTEPVVQPVVQPVDAKSLQFVQLVSIKPLGAPDVESQKTDCRYQINISNLSEKQVAVVDQEIKSHPYLSGQSFYLIDDKNTFVGAIGYNESFGFVRLCYDKNKGWEWLDGINLRIFFNQQIADVEHATDQDNEQGDWHANIEASLANLIDRHAAQASWFADSNTGCIDGAQRIWSSVKNNRNEFWSSVARLAAIETNQFFDRKDAGSKKALVAGIAADVTRIINDFMALKNQKFKTYESWLDDSSKMFMIADFANILVKSKKLYNKLSDKHSPALADANDEKVNKIIAIVKSFGRMAPHFEGIASVIRSGVKFGRLEEKLGIIASDRCAQILTLFIALTRIAEYYVETADSKSKIMQAVPYVMLASTILALIGDVKNWWTNKTEDEVDEY